MGSTRLGSRSDEFWRRVDRGQGCWEWQGYVRPDGYGQFTYRYVNRLAHRTAYELSVGEIPDALPLDHLCRNRRCVRPDHLEPVTLGENTRRGLAGQLLTERQHAKTHCPQGHPYTPENTYRRPHVSGYRKEPERQCRICRNEVARQSRMRKKERNIG